jgi:hypothetical protein
MDETFDAMYANSGRDSIPPEQLLRGLILQAPYGLRSERRLGESLGHNMLYRWFAGLSLEKAPGDHSTYTKNRDRLIAHEAGRARALRARARAGPCQASPLLGALPGRWHPRSGVGLAPEPCRQGRPTPAPRSGPRANPEVDFRGEPRTNDTHRSTTHPDSRLYKKSPGTGAIPAYMGHVLTENRNGLIVDERLTQASGTAEREAALEMLGNLPGERRPTAGADKAPTTPRALRCRLP